VRLYVRLRLTANPRSTANEIPGAETSPQGWRFLSYCFDFAGPVFVVSGLATVPEPRPPKLEAQYKHCGKLVKGENNKI
jgi:hypothetical protein